MCCVAPHPPILVPEVGGGEVRHVQKSAAALETLASEIEEVAPDVLVIMSPHTPICRNAFTVKTAPALGGSFSMFGAPQVRVDAVSDIELAMAVLKRAREMGVPCEATGERGAGDLDHGILVPLYFLAKRSYPLVCLSLSLLDFEAHYMMGIAIRKAVESVGRKAVFIASGDMSHRLIPTAPAGYSPRGAEFDALIVDIVSSGDFTGLFELDSRLVDEAGECGLRSLVTMAGTVDGCARSSEVLSYEGPFGVGYMVARMRPGEPDATLSLVGKDGTT